MSTQGQKTCIMCGIIDRHLGGCFFFARVLAMKPVCKLTAVLQIQDLDGHTVFRMEESAFCRSDEDPYTVHTRTIKYVIGLGPEIRE